MPRRRKAVLATLDGVTHSALEDVVGAVTTACGIPCGRATLYSIGVFEAGTPEIDCMACVAATCAG